ncbi:MAG: SDR family NAD(P)-dependent oxidoreductase [Candidatus Eremiobacteraeota bacterium]|nr:SDR family NAD(P)-dependent oxidoreductase [Candidatus Eremiobacteraeota bacterium]MCW5870304.1 SDR family NAD(P)-dependent oxidoreductase [Candidatus Eremiobacteraeota bacterium]
MKDQVCWVTGASAGIGRAVVQRFAEAGAKVLAMARREERLVELRDQFPEQVRVLVCDVTDEEKLRRSLSELEAPFHEPSILVNNAGAAFGLEMAQSSRWIDWQRMIDLNVTSLVCMTHYVLPGMVERNRGHILNLGSVAGTYPYRGGQVYGASKAFVEQFSLGLRCDLLGKQVRVTNIEPGAVQSEFATVRFEGDAEKAAKVYEGFQPLTPADIAETVFWCAALPAHVNINRLEVMPVMQASAGFVWHRDDP